MGIVNYFEQSNRFNAIFPTTTDIPDNAIKIKNHNNLLKSNIDNGASEFSAPIGPYLAISLKVNSTLF